MGLAAIAAGGGGVGVGETLDRQRAVELDGDDLVAEALAGDLEVADVGPAGTFEVAGGDVVDGGLVGGVGERGDRAVAQADLDDAAEAGAGTGAAADQDVLVVVEGIEGHVGVLEREDPAVGAGGEGAAAQGGSGHGVGGEGEGDGIDLEDAMQVGGGVGGAGELEVDVAAGGGDREVAQGPGAGA